VEEVVTATTNRIEKYQDDGPQKRSTTPKKSHTISLDRPTRTIPPNNMNNTTTSNSSSLKRDKSPHQSLLAARTSTASTWSHSSGRYSSEEVDLDDNNDAGAVFTEEDSRNGRTERNSSQKFTDNISKRGSFTTDALVSPHKNGHNPSIGSYVDTSSSNRLNMLNNTKESTSKDKFGTISTTNFDNDNEQLFPTKYDLQLPAPSRLDASPSNGNKLDNTQIRTSQQQSQSNLNQFQQLPKNSNINNNSGRVEESLPSGGKLIRYSNGTTKEVSADGLHSIVCFTNGDYKKTDSSNGSSVVIYYYKLADTTHTTFQDGTELYEFPNKQVMLVMQLYFF